MSCSIVYIFFIHMTMEMNFLDTYISTCMSFQHYVIIRKKQKGEHQWQATTILLCGIFNNTKSVYDKMLLIIMAYRCATHSMQNIFKFFFLCIVFLVVHVDSFCYLSDEFKIHHYTTFLFRMYSVYIVEYYAMQYVHKIHI